MEISTFRPPTSPPDPFYAASLFWAASPSFPGQNVGDYLDTPAFNAILNSTQPSAMPVKTLYALTFGNGTATHTALVMLKEKLSHQNYWALVTGVSVLVMSISSLLVLVRLVGKWKLLPQYDGRLQLGDWLIFAAWIINVFSGTILFALPNSRAYYGHQWDITWNEMIYLFNWFRISNTFCLLGHALVQFSFLAMYHYSFQLKRTILYSVAAAVSCGTIALLPLHWTFCSTLIQHPTDIPALVKCAHGSGIILTASSLFFVVTDFMVMALPVTTISKLAIPAKKKVLVTVMFTVGALACVFSILRVVIAFSTALSFCNDVTAQVTSKLTLFGLLELHFGMACACLPTVRALYRRWRDNRQASTVLEVYEAQGQVESQTMTMTKSAHWVDYADGECHAKSCMRISRDSEMQTDAGTSRATSLTR